MIGEHGRHDGYLDALRELHKRVAEDLQAKRGDIRPPKVKHAYYDSKIVLMLKAKVLDFVRKSA